MNQSFINQKEALLKEYQKLEKEAKTAFAKVNQLYANRIMDAMNRHGVKEILLYDEDRDALYPVYRDKEYMEWENQRYYTYYYEVDEDSYNHGEKEFWICRFAIMDDQLMMSVQEFDSETEEYSEEEWRPFSDIDNIHDLEFKEPLIRWLEESEEAYDIVREHPELLVLED